MWVGSSDHLVITCTKESSRVFTEAFDRVKSVLDLIEQSEGVSFVKSEWAGYVTSSPVDLGMTAKVWLGLPGVTQDGSDMREAEAIAKRVGLTVSGFGNGRDGAVELSMPSRFGPSEAQTMVTLYNGVVELVTLESRLAEEKRIQTLLDQISAVQARDGSNIMAKHFDMAYFDSLPLEQKAQLLQVCTEHASDSRVTNLRESDVREWCYSR